MKKVSIRDLSRNFYASIGDLPLIVTKNGKDYATIELVDVVTPDVVTSITPVNSEPKNVVTIEDKPVDKLESDVRTNNQECWVCDKEAIYFHKNGKGVCTNHYERLNKIAKTNYAKS